MSTTIDADGKPVALAKRHACTSSLQSVHCTRGNGQPTRKACAHCGGRLRVEEGLWGVFVWTGTGRYPVEDAVSTTVREAVAEDRLEEDSRYVVRWIPS